MSKTQKRVQRFYGLKDLLTILGVSRSWVYEEINAGRFPKPVQIGRRRVAWREGDVATWQEGLKAA